MSWPVKATLLSLALLVGFFDHALGGWGEPVAMAATAIAVPVLLRQSREFWNQSRFWITVLLLILAQVPLVIAIQPKVAQGGFAFVLAVGVADCVVVALALTWVCKL